MSRVWCWFWLLLALGSLAFNLSAGSTVGTCMTALAAGFWIGVLTEHRPRPPERNL